jgi:hypothetical protein
MLPSPIHGYPISTAMFYNTDGSHSDTWGPGTGMQVVDLNDDMFPDLIVAFNNANTNGDWGGKWYVNCVYMNTQCGWVLSSQYQGPVYTCQPATFQNIRQIAMHFEGMTVGDFRKSIAEEFALPLSAIRISSQRDGLTQGMRVPMSALLTHGFTTHITDKGTTEQINQLGFRKEDWKVPAV